MAEQHTKGKPALNRSGRQPVVRDEHGLTTRERLFADSYLLNRNATRSAILSGSKPSNAPSWGSDMLKKPVVAAYIEHATQETLKQLEIERADVLRELWYVVKSNVSDYMRKGRTIVAVPGMDPLVTKAISKIKIKSKTYIEEGEPVTEHEMEYALHPKVAAIDSMMKRLDMYPRQGRVLEIEDDGDGTLIIKEVVE